MLSNHYIIVLETLWYYPRKHSKIFTFMSLKKEGRLIGTKILYQTRILLEFMLLTWKQRQYYSTCLIAVGYINNFF